MVLPPFGTQHLGTVPTPSSGTITGKSWGGDSAYFTELTLVDVPVVVPAGAAALAGGALIYTLPAGNVIVKSAAININVQDTGTANAAKTPDLGIGTTIGSGASATLNLVDSGNAENIMTGQTLAALSSAATVRKVASVNTILAVPTANAHTIYLNCADTWAGADVGNLASGKVVIEWKYLD